MKPARRTFSVIPPAHGQHSALDVVEVATDVAALPELVVVRVGDQVRPQVVLAELTLPHLPVLAHLGSQVLDRTSLEEKVVAIVSDNSRNLR